jgi:hypothetical protein
MVVVRRTSHGAYVLAELNGAVGKQPYTTFRVILYHARSQASIPVEQIIGPSDIPDTPDALYEDILPHDGLDSSEDSDLQEPEHAGDSETSDDELPHL